MRGWTTRSVLLVALATTLGTLHCADTASFDDGGGERDQYIPVDIGDLAPTDSTCASQSYQAKQVRAAMMIVLDRSSSMATDNKWQAAQLAIVKAIDKPAFDGIDLGLLAYPSTTVNAPPCLLLPLPVTCGVTALPQVPISDTGSKKSNASSGPRHLVYSWLTSNGPDNTLTDASPGYEALAGAIASLQSHQVDGKRFILFITDGGFSCASVSTRPGYSDGQCPDWEYPDTVVALLKKAHDDANKPIQTFIVGVPGSASNGQNQGIYATPPYSMRLALSTYAFTGSPTSVPSGCNGKSFTQQGTDPTTPCHFDMTKPGGFDADKLASIIGEIRGKVLGCTYDLPQPQGGGTVDRDKVNVEITPKGGSADTIPKRSDPNDTCETKGCWDYDKDGKVVIIGKSCDDIKAASEIKVDILVGCKTIIK